MTIINYEELAGMVAGVNEKGNEFTFDLKVKEVKHVRKCLRLYYEIHPYDDLGRDILNKFLKFGFRREKPTSEHRKLIKPLGPYICNHPGCMNQSRLTIDHIIPLSEGGKDDSSNTQWLCSPHHNIKNYESRIQENLKAIESLNKMKEVEQHKAAQGKCMGRVKQIPLKIQ